MASALLCVDFPDVTEFDTQVLEVTNLPDGKVGAILAPTYFYPTGGGQEHDTGSIGTAAVTDVYQQEGRIMHVLDRELKIGLVRATIDRQRRLRHMQHHSAQHLLTQCFIQIFQIDTLSANINGYTSSTLDLPLAGLRQEEIDQVEDMANRIIFEDRIIKSYYVSQDEIDGIPLRRKPTVTENIRIVEIDHLDYTPCGGTHCHSTGEIGPIKILKSEKTNRDRLRIFFVAGLRTLEYLREYHQIITTLACNFKVGTRDIIPYTLRLADELRSTREDLKDLHNQNLKLEALQLIEKAEIAGTNKVIIAAYANRPSDELKSMAEEICSIPGTLVVLTTFDAQKLTHVVSCGSASPITARQLLQSILSVTGGRGGGNASLAQGGGQSTPELFSSINDLIKKIIHTLLFTE